MVILNMYKVLVFQSLCDADNTVKMTERDASLCMRLEAEYAYNKGKHIIALRMEAGYKPEGWLGPLCVNNIHIHIFV